MKNNLVGVITKIHILQNHVTFQLDIIRGTLSFMEMFPCPAAGTFLGFGENAVFLFCVDKSNVAFVHFRFLIQKIKDTFGTCKGHNNTVELLADLVDGRVKTLVESQEAGKSAKSEVSDAIDGKDTANHGTDHVADVSKLGNYRHQDVGKTVGVVCAGKKLVVQLIEFLDAFVLMAEDFDNFLSFHHLFDIAVDNTKVCLLFQEIFSAQARKFPAGSQHNGNHKQSHESKRNVEDQHTYKNTDNGDHTGKQLWETLADHLAQGINVVGVDGHDITVCVGIKIFDGKCFHFCKHAVSEVT